MTTLKLLIAVAAFAATTAHAVEYNTIQLGQSQVGFISKQMNVPVDGAFRKFNAQITFDSAKPEASRTQIDIDIASVDAGSEDANVELKRKDWFDTQNHPTARFVSSSVKTLGGNKYETLGKMTIKGVTRDVKVPFTVNTNGNNAQVDGNITIQRLQYNIGTGVWSDTSTVANEVVIKFRFLVAAGLGAANRK